MQNQALKVLAFSIAIFTSIIFVVYILLDQNGTDTVNYFFESISGFMSGSITSLSMILPIGFAFDWFFVTMVRNGYRNRIDSDLWIVVVWG